MSEEMIHLIQEAASRSRRWAETGWPMTFGKNHRAVNSLNDALKLDPSFVHRSEAVSYWNHVKQTGEEAALWGERAAEALRKEDRKDADDALYFTVFIEKPLRSQAPEWSPVFRRWKELSGG